MSVRPNIALPDDLHRRMKMQAIDQGVTVQAYIVNSIWKIVLHDEASVHQRKAAKEPKLHSDFLGKRNIFAVMDGTIPQPSALAAKEPTK